MAGVLGSKAFSVEYMAQMSLALATDNLYTLSISISYFQHSAFNLVIEAWPATFRLKLIFRPIKWGMASFADIGAFLFIVQQSTRIGRFCTFINDNTFFLFSKRIIGLFFYSGIGSFLIIKMGLFLGKGCGGLNGF